MAHLICLIACLVAWWLGRSSAIRLSAIVLIMVAALLYIGWVGARYGTGGFGGTKDPWALTTQPERWLIVVAVVASVLTWALNPTEAVSWVFLAYAVVQTVLKADEWRRHRRLMRSLDTTPPW